MVDSETFVARDSAGVRIGENSAALGKEDEFWTVDPDPVLVIGETSDVPGEQFERVQDVRRLEDGRIVVSDAGALEVRFFSADGAFLYSLGGRGKGPGEFLDLGCITIVAPDSLFVFDAQQRRVSVINLAGDFAGSLPLGSTGDAVRSLALYDLGGIYDDGTFLMVPTRVPASITPRSEIYWDSVPNLRYSRAGGLMDTIGGFSGRHIASTGRFTVVPPFAGASYYAFRDGYFYIGRGDRFEIRVYDDQGKLRHLIRKVHNTGPVTDRDIEQWIEFHIRQVEGSESESARAAARKYLREVQVPSSKPAHADIVVDSERNLWVRNFTPPWHTGPVPWSVFNPRGRWLGDVQLPRELSPTEIGGGFVLGIWRNELDVESVRLYRLRKPAGRDGSE
jgi:hypothetical protein